MDNKTSKYFKYAIGEIVLVVIGILIALQINNWNEKRKSTNIRDNYYHQVLQDLEKDTIYINRSIKYLDSCLLKYQNYLKKLPQVENIYEVAKETSKLNWEFQYITFNTNTIESLISTGDIKLMPDNIRNGLLDLKTEQNKTIKTTLGNNEVYLRDSQKAVGLGCINFILDINPKLSSQLMQNEDIISATNILNGTFQLKNFTEKNLLRSMKTILKSTKELSEVINEELK